MQQVVKMLIAIVSSPANPVLIIQQDASSSGSSCPPFALALPNIFPEKRWGIKKAQGNLLRFWWRMHHELSSNACPRSTNFGASRVEQGDWVPSWAEKSWGVA
jgi:hypothetical protein